MSIPLFRAYLFDVDGTLLDSAPDICGAIQTVLSTSEKRDTPFEFLKSYIGRHLIDLFEDLFPHASPEQVQAWIQQYREVYAARGHQNTVLYPGVGETLANLAGLKTTATTKATSTANIVLTKFGLTQYFNHVQGTDGFPSKPAPDVLFRAMAGLDARPEECLFVGDSVPDMIAGKAAGVKVCAVSYGYGKPDELRACAPDYWLDDFAGIAAGA